MIPLLPICTPNHYSIPTTIPHAPYFPPSYAPTITAIELPDVTLHQGDPGITTKDVSLSLGTSQIVVGTITQPFATYPAEFAMTLYPTGIDGSLEKECEPVWGLNGWAHVPIDVPPVNKVRRAMEGGKDNAAVRGHGDGVGLVGVVVIVMGLMVMIL